MKGLLTYLAPFAPDQSGACGALFDLNGILVVLDAGGCTGNICGFDEPRWFRSRSRIFSAGLRDMDAILGRDDAIVKKLSDITKQMEAPFAALIGTPVPAVIATDYAGIKHMAEKKCNVPVLTVECTGTDLYDSGEETAYLELFENFLPDLPGAPSKKTVGVLGVTPLNTSYVRCADVFTDILHKAGAERVLCYGSKNSDVEVAMETITEAYTVEKNYVIAHSGLKAAKLLEKKYGTPYEIVYPLFDKKLAEKILYSLYEDTNVPSGIRMDARILLVMEQVQANTLRSLLSEEGAKNITVASFFELKPKLRKEGDTYLKGEADFRKFVYEGDFDLIVGDAFLARAVRDYQGAWYDLPHFAVSGTLYDGNEV